MPRTRWKSCRRKTRHTTKEDARHHLEALIRDGAPRSQLEVYKCRFCRQYHVGHRIGSGGRRK